MREDVCKRVKKAIVIAVILLNPISLGLLVVASVAWSNSFPGIGEHVDRVAWLPREASDISYYKSYSSTAYEFLISEAEFRGWASRYDLMEVEGEFMIERYNRLLIDQSEYFSDGGKEWEDFERIGFARITNGLCYRTPPRGNGGGTYVVYDRDFGRAYYQHSPR